MKYFVILFALFCIFSISISESFGQYIGDKIPPGTILPHYGGDNIFPPDYVDFYYSDSQFEKYAVIAEQYRYDIPYMISNGSISKMSMDCSGVELVLDITSSGKQGWITLALPRHLIDSKASSQQDDGFFTLSGSKDTQRSYTVASEKLGLLLIPFSNNTSQVSIVGMNDPEQTGANACNGKHEPPFSFSLYPLKQFNSGIPFDEIQCKQNLVLLQKYDGSPACVKPETKQKLIERGWTDSTMSTKSNECSTDMKEYPLSKPLSDVYANRLVLFMQPESTASFCVYYKSNLDNTGTIDITPTLYTGEILLEKYEGSKVSVDVEPKNVPLERGTETFAKFTVTTTQNSTGVYHVGITQLSRLPLVVWEDRQSVGANEIPVYSGFRSSGNIVLDAALLWHEEDDFLNYSVAEIQR